MKTYKFYAAGRWHEPASGDYFESFDPTTAEPDLPPGVINVVAAGIWSRDSTRAIRIAERIDAGTVYINNYFNAATQSPVGGFKQSGYGRENGIQGMKAFMQTKSVWLDTDPSQVESVPPYSVGYTSGQSGPVYPLQNNTPNHTGRS